jgi:predicted phosphate transport protein (TIGR00153 family)
MFKLIPHDEKYFELFGVMGKHLKEGASLLKNLFADFDRREDYAHEIKLVEHQCDELTHSIVRKLNKSFITPIDREDIYALAGGLDDVLDLIDSTAGSIVLFGVDRPTDYAKQLAQIILRATVELGKAVAELGRNSNALKHCIEIHSMENEADVVYHQALAQLFTNPTDPFYVIKWKDLYSMLEKCVDKCEDVANVIESIVLKNA